MQFSAQWRLPWGETELKVTQFTQKQSDPLVPLSPNKSRRCQCSGRLQCQPVQSRRVGAGLSDGFGVDWTHGVVDWLAQRGRHGGKHFLCVLMEAPADALWGLVCGGGCFSRPVSFSSIHIAFAVPVNQRRKKWKDTDFWVWMLWNKTFTYSTFQWNNFFSNRFKQLSKITMYSFAS